MRVLINSILKEADEKRVRMEIQIGDEPAQEFFGEYDGTDPQYKFSSVDEKLFMRLSDLSAKRYCNSAIYQFELMDIIGAYCRGMSTPQYPIELGTTDFGMRRPSRIKIGCDRIRRPFMIVWYWWKFRKVRKENAITDTQKTG